MGLMLEVPHQRTNPWERKGLLIMGEGSPLRGHCLWRQESAAAEIA